MDELGSYPRMRYGDNNQYNQNPDQRGSWFGLAISGLKFLISNQNNNSVNHNLAANSQTNSTHSSSNNTPKNTNLQILGPSVLRKQLYDIPEYGTSNASSNDIKTTKNNFDKLSKNARLTKQALKQFNGNFSNYWNQRSSLHNYDESVYSDAGSLHTTRTLTDAASSAVPPQPNEVFEEYRPSMTSSQIIHPSQDKRPLTMKRVKSWPLLHSTECFQNFEQFSRELDGTDFVPASPPPISSTPDFKLMSLKNVNAIKSWETVQTCSNVVSVHSLDSELAAANMNDAIVLNSDYIKPTATKQRKKRYVRSNSGSERDWTECNEAIKVISGPLPKSLRKYSKKQKKKSQNDEEEIAMSDWSNISSNIGVTTPQFYNNMQ